MVTFYSPRKDQAAAFFLGKYKTTKVWVSHSVWNKLYYLIFYLKIKLRKRTYLYWDTDEAHAGMVDVDEMFEERSNSSGAH